MTSSAFTPSVLTIAGSSAATSGEKNYILAPDSNTAGLWVASGVTISTSTSTIPDNITKTTSLAVAWSSGTTGYARYRFTLDQADYGKKFKVSWDQIYGTAGHWTLEVYSNTAADYSGTSTKLTVQTSAIPGITGTFTTSVDMPGSSAPYIEVRVIASSTSATTIYFNNFTVGPGTIVQGAAISEWVSYTPATSIANTTLQHAFYRRVGSNAEIRFSIVSSGGNVSTFADAAFLPPSLTINLSAIQSSSGARNVIGHINITDSGITDGGVAELVYVIGTGFVVYGTVTPGNADTVRIQASVPIAEWSGSGTVNLGPGAQVEYASNSSSTTTAGATISESTTVYGPNGSALVNYASTTTTGESKTIVKVQFQYPKQNDEVVSIELFDGISWVPAESKFPGITLNAASYGILIASYSSTVFGIAFGNAGYGPSGSTTYAAAGGAWSVLAGLGWRWRLRKAKASSPVGFGLAGTDGSSGLYKPGSAPGYTGGVAIPAGYVGEIVSATLSTTTVTTSEADITGASLTLSAGIWIISYSVSANVATGATSGNITYCSALITNASNTKIGVSSRSALIKTVAAVSAEIETTLQASEIVNISTTTTYKLRAKRTDTNGTGSAAISANTGDRQSNFFAIRIA